jgi:hypothetical protein
VQSVETQSKVRDGAFCDPAAYQLSVPDLEIDTTL